MPLKHRKSFDTGALVITIDINDPCLLVYSVSEWQELEQKLIKLPNFDNRIRKIQRLLVGHAYEIEFDSVGRILLPTTLRTHANLTKSMVLVGQMNKLEIWSDSNWQQASKLWMESTSQKEAIDSLNSMSL